MSKKMNLKWIERRKSSSIAVNKLNGQMMFLFEDSHHAKFKRKTGLN